MKLVLVFSSGLIVRFKIWKCDYPLPDFARLSLLFTYINICILGSRFFCD